MFVFSYTVILHLLIFAVLMRWSHRHSTSVKDLVALCAKQVTLTLPPHLEGCPRLCTGLMKRVCRPGCHARWGHAGLWTAMHICMLHTNVRLARLPKRSAMLQADGAEAGDPRLPVGL